MNNSCTNKKLGGLLHAYEIGVLSDDLADAVEIHILECDYCLARLQEFKGVEDMLSRDEIIVKEIERLDRDIQKQGQAALKKIDPLPLNRPVIFRPAFLFMVCILLAAALAVALIVRQGVEPGPLQEINLINYRAGGTRIVIHENSGHISVSFGCPANMQNGPCSVTLERNSRDTVYYDANFKYFDSYHTGRLLIPNDPSLSGRYHLILRTRGESGESLVSEYAFTIARE